MRNLQACLVVALAACGGGSSGSKQIDAAVQIDAHPTPDAKVFLDAPADAAPVADLACLGNAAPTTAAANVTVSGTVNEITTSLQFAPLQGATMDACKGNCTNANKLATNTTDAQGAYSDGPIATGSTPLDAYLKLTKSGYVTVLEYPGEPITADLSGVPLFTAQTTTFALLAGPNGLMCNTAQGFLAIAVTDCANQPINDGANLTLTVEQNGAPVAGTKTTNLGSFSSMAAGTYLVCNVPANAATHVGATYKGMTFLAHDVNVVGGQITATQVRPGY